MILLDTHTLIWLSTGNSRLGERSRRVIDAGYQEGELAVSAISFWEVAMLVERKRVELSMSVTGWRKDLLGTGLEEVKASGEIGILAATLEDFHGDPADRLITATALEEGAQLITADGKILCWPGNLSRQDATR